MPDTRRNLAALQTLLADNTVGAISAQDIRDMLVSLVPAVGKLSLSASSATTIGSSATFVKVAGTTTLGTGHEFDMPADNRLRYTGPGQVVVLVLASVTMTTASANVVTSWALAKNGTVAAETTTQALEGATPTDEVSLSVLGVMTLATNDYVEVWAANETSATNLTAKYLQLAAFGMIDPAG